eukprot:SAG22_NODE_1546_length_4151_cov_6.763820_5_plen_79_part_01
MSRGTHAAGVEADVGRVLQLEPANPKALFRRGLARAELSDWAGAAADYAAVVDAQPENRVALKELAAAKARLAKRSPAP